MPNGFLARATEVLDTGATRLHYFYTVYAANLFRSNRQADGVDVFVTVFAIEDAEMDRAYTEYADGTGEGQVA